MKHKRHIRVTEKQLTNMANKLMGSEETVAVNQWLSKKTQTLGYNGYIVIEWFCNSLMMITVGNTLYSQ